MLPVLPRFDGHEELIPTLNRRQKRVLDAMAKYHSSFDLDPAMDSAGVDVLFTPVAVPMRNPVPEHELGEIHESDLQHLMKWGVIECVGFAVHEQVFMTGEYGEREAGPMLAVRLWQLTAKPTEDFRLNDAPDTVTKEGREEFLRENFPEAYEPKPKKD